MEAQLLSTSSRHGPGKGGHIFLEERSRQVVYTDGSLVLVEIKGFEATSVDDGTFVEAIAGDFDIVKLLYSGKVLWTWTDLSSGANCDTWGSVDTDSNDDVSTAAGKTLEGIHRGQFARFSFRHDLHARLNGPYRRTSV